jgi:hypothetical protein
MLPRRLCARSFDFLSSRYSATALSFIFVLIIGNASINAQQADSDTETPEALTAEMAAADNEYQSADERQRPQAEAKLARVAARRARRLAAMLDRDPRRVLRVAMPKARRDRLPVSVQPQVEEQLATQGDLEVLEEDYLKEHRLRFFLKEHNGRRMSLHFAEHPPALRSGSKVRVKGVKVGDAMALDSGSTSSVEVMAVPPLPNTFGTQRTVVILVNFSNSPATQPYTVSFAQNVVFNQTSNFYNANSFGQTSLSGDVFGWFTIATTSAGCDYNSIAAQADSAATMAGVTLANYTRRVYAFPQNGCGWWGLGTVGGLPSRAWINGSFALQVVGHEMGHNFGLYHARSMDCGTVTLGPSCTTSEYGDTSDIMGYSSGQFSPFAKERLGWLNSGAQPPIMTVSGTGTYLLEAYESQSAGTKALKILKSTDASGRRTWYYLEYRTSPSSPRGVMLRLGTDNSPASSYLLDGTPATSSFSDAAIPMGTVFRDTGSGVTITPVTLTEGTAAVVVQMGAETCVPTAPTVTITPAQSDWVQAGTAVTFSVSIANNDSSECSSSTFSLQHDAASDWSATFGDPNPSIAPGGSLATSFVVTSPATSTEGFYTLNVTATSSSGSNPSGSATATYVVAPPATTSATAPPTMSVTTNLTSALVKRGKKITLTAAVTKDGTPVKKAKVVLTIYKPNGKTLVRKPITNGYGNASSAWKPTKREPVGTYRVTTTAEKDGVTATAPEITFDVR